LVGWLSRISALTSASTRAISSSEIGAMCAKSNRVRSAVDQRALLLDVRAEHLAQRLVHQVRGRVVAHRAPARLVVDVRRDRVADAQLAGPDLAQMPDDVRLDLLRVLDREQRQAHAGLGELAAVADLAARLGVERRAREHDDAALAGRQAVDLRAVAVQRDDLRLRRERVVAVEARLRAVVRERLAGLELRRRRVRACAARPSRCRRRIRRRTGRDRAARRPSGRTGSRRCRRA
jgi:hypothetical protein